MDYILSKDSIQDMTFERRREYLEENIPDMFIKPISHVRNPSEMKRKCPKTALSYCIMVVKWLITPILVQVLCVSAQKPQEMCLGSSVVSGCILKVVGYALQVGESQREMVLMDIMKSAQLEPEPDLEKKLGKMTKDAKALEGEIALMKVLLLFKLMFTLQIMTIEVLSFKVLLQT